MALAGARYLADTSAWHWAPAVAKRWRKLLQDHQIATCSVVEFEYLWSAASKDKLLRSHFERDVLVSAPINQPELDRAMSVMMELGTKQEMGHRSVKMADLLVAAAAERAGLTVLHYDRDFDRIAEITGQRSEWLAKRGTLKR